MNIYEKLQKIQLELKAPKAQLNDYGGYKYRNVEDIMKAVKPLLKETKTSIILSDEVVLIGDRYYVKATASLIKLEKDDDGLDTINVPAYARESETKKGMDPSQITGAASSYARKYALNGLLAIDDTKDADSLNNSEIEPKMATNEQINTIQELIESTGTDIMKFMGNYKVKKYAELTEREAKNAIILLNKKSKESNK